MPQSIITHGVCADSNTLENSDKWNFYLHNPSNTAAYIAPQTYTMTNLVSQANLTYT